MPAIINLYMTAAEDRTFTLSARDYDNAALSLSAASISWRVGQSPYNPTIGWPTFTKTGTVTDAANGEFTVSVTAADTQWLDGDYRHQAWVTIAGLSYLVTEGRLRIRNYIQNGDG